MSTKMYNYRLPKADWWVFAKACREYYLVNHPVMEILKASGEGLASYNKITEAVDCFVEYPVNLQLFDEGDTYLVRPLEIGYFFMNHYDKFAPDLTPVTYDNRTDVPPEDEKNKIVAEWVDAKIHNGEYLTFTVMDRDDFISIALDRLMSVLRNTTPTPREEEVK